MINRNVAQTLLKSSEKITGPVLFDFVYWVLNEALLRNIKTLFFLARDGYTLHKIANLIVKRFNLPLTCKYLYCSRNSLRLPTYHFIGEEAYELLFLGGYNVTFNSLLDRGSLSDTVKEKIRQEIKIDRVNYDRPLSKMELKKYASQLRENQTYRKAIYQISLNMYPATIGYLKQEGLFEEEQVAIVDSGWTGSMQRSLRQLLESSGFSGFLVGFYFGMFTQPKDPRDGDYLTWYFNNHRKLLDKALFCNNLFECILSAPHGMTLSYEKQGDTFIPLLTTEPDPDTKELIQVQIGGILNFTKFMLKSDTVKFNQKSSINQTRKLLHRFMAHPTKKEVMAYGCFRFDDDTKDNQKRPIANKEQVSLLRKYIIPIRILQKTKKHCSATPNLFWPYGTIALLPKWQQWWYRLNIYLWEFIKYSLKSIL